MRSVATIARLGKQVRPEGGELLGGQQFFYVAVIPRVIEVVDPLGPPVAEPSHVFEEGRPAHKLFLSLHPNRG